MQKGSKVQARSSKDGTKSQKTTPVKDATKEQPPKDLLTHLPLNRIRTIMKSAPDSDMIGQEALVLVCKSAEMFVQDITKRAMEKSTKSNALNYKDLAEVVANDEKLEFLASIIPKKITVRKYRELLEEESSSSDLSGGDSEESDSEEESSGDESSGKEENAKKDDDVVSINSSNSNDGSVQFVDS